MQPRNVPAGPPRLVAFDQEGVSDSNGWLPLLRISRADARRLESTRVWVRRAKLEPGQFGRVDLDASLRCMIAGRPPAVFCAMLA